jgi:hypothetical protein
MLLILISEAQVPNRTNNRTCEALKNGSPGVTAQQKPAWLGASQTGFSKREPAFHRALSQSLPQALAAGDARPRRGSDETTARGLPTMPRASKRRRLGGRGRRLRDPNNMHQAPFRTRTNYSDFKPRCHNLR